MIDLTGPLAAAAPAASEVGSTSGFGVPDSPHQGFPPYVQKFLANFSQGGSDPNARSLDQAFNLAKSSIPQRNVQWNDDAVRQSMGLFNEEAAKAIPIPERQAPAMPNPFQVGLSALAGAAAPEYAAQAMAMPFMQGVQTADQAYADATAKYKLQSDQHAQALDNDYRRASLAQQEAVERANIEAGNANRASDAERSWLDNYLRFSQIQDGRRQDELARADAERARLTDELNKATTPGGIDSAAAALSKLRPDWAPAPSEVEARKRVASEQLANSWAAKQRPIRGLDGTISSDDRERLIKQAREDAGRFGADFETYAQMVPDSASSLSDKLYREQAKRMTGAFDVAKDPAAQAYAKAVASYEVNRQLAETLRRQEGLLTAKGSVANAHRLQVMKQVQAAMTSARQAARLWHDLWDRNRPSQFGWPANGNRSELDFLQANAPPDVTELARELNELRLAEGAAESYTTSNGFTVHRIK